LVALALLVWLSPAYATSVQPLLEVLGAKETVGKKVKGWKKKDVRKLAEEFAGKLC
jgi:membrane glycosyltransferase